MVRMDGLVMTVLMMAASNGYVNVVRGLVEVGAKGACSCDVVVY
jgi:hypothetical protein